MREGPRVALAVLAISALGVSVSRAETVTVPPCGSTPGTTTSAYSGLVSVTVSGSLVITPGNPDQDAFFNFNQSNPSTPVSENRDTFRYNRVGEGTCLCGFECPSTNHRVSDILVGPYPTYSPSHTYTVQLDLGASAAQPLHFGIYDCGCGDNSGQLTVNVAPTTCTATTLPGGDADADGLPDAQEACGCLGTASGVPVTALGCSIDQVCPCAAPIGRSHWANHGDYVRCVKGAARESEGRGVLPVGNGKQIVRAAGRSACGR